MAYVLIHNPGCGSSKKGLELLESKGVKVDVRKYMGAAERLSAAGLPETASDAEVFAAMAENPKLIQRPIGLNGQKAVLGRPNDRLLEIL